MTLIRLASFTVAAGALALPLLADENSHDPSKCQGLPGSAQLKTALAAAPGIVSATIGGNVGGLFGGTRMWAAVVDRDGRICAATTSTDDPTQVWPGSQAIAKAKAFTANAFSLDGHPLSTAMLYTLTQPGHSLWSLGQSNLWNPNFTLDPVSNGGGQNAVAGGMIFFGGGVPLYVNGGSIIGGLGVSGDTSCADHEIAKRVRQLLGLNPTGGPTADDIKFSSDAGGPTVFDHPKCPATYRNGVSLGDEKPSNGTY
jgi:uncharacterized protein GlcG (DUF336 family)